MIVAWSLFPAIPTLLKGQLLGHPHTDLYPSVWGLWWFANAQPGFPTHTELLNHPEGMGMYFSSPIKGWLAWPLIPIMGLTHTWNLLVIAARVMTASATWCAARAWGLGGPGALTATAMFGCAPFFHGFAVEGIVEGTDGWALALLAWSLAPSPNPIGWRRQVTVAGLLALTILANWYLGMAGCLLLLFAAVRNPRLLSGFFGLVLAAPAIAAFVQAFPGGSPLPDAVRINMGAQLTVPEPGLASTFHPFAMTNYIGWIAVIVGLLSRSRWLLLAIIPAILSTGMGPLYDLPVMEMVRFPYRWHAAPLLILAIPVGQWADTHRSWFLGPLILLEGLALSPVEPIIPGASSATDTRLLQIDGPVLDLPGPVAMPPGVENPSRKRAKNFLFDQTVHHQPSPWAPDFNSVGVTASQQTIQAFRSFDHLDPEFVLPDEQTLSSAAIDMLADSGIQWITIRKPLMNSNLSKTLRMP